MIHTGKPSDFLSPYVKSYWMIENMMADGREHTQRIVPTGLTELSFYLGDQPSCSDPGKSFSEHGVLTGQINNPFDLHIRGRLSLFSVCFYPHGLTPFLDFPVKELKNQSFPVSFIFGGDGKELAEKLSTRDSFHQRISIMEAYLYRRLTRQKHVSDDPRARYSIRLINKSKGLLNIDQLASWVCLSRKQFERVFLNHVGISPWQFSRIVRFQNALQIKAGNHAVSLTELAYDCGYYDQSHMINEFINLSGKSPGSYFDESQPYSDYFQ